MSSRDHALVETGALLRTLGYHFTTITPESHRRVLERRESMVGRSLRDALGWNMPFPEDAIPARIVELLRAAEALEHVADGLLRSRVRFSTLRDQVYLHSAYPTLERDAVFFGPDSYRFADLLRRTVNGARRAVDIGCGTGVGGLTIAPHCERVTLTDINERAVRYARINASIMSATNADFAVGDLFDTVDGDVDLVIANPPYLVDPEQRAYRHGGDSHGASLSARIVEGALARLSRGGRLVLYTGSAIVEGRDSFLELVEPLLEQARARVLYEELDPDVFGEELERPAYEGVERIAVVALIAQKP